MMYVALFITLGVIMFGYAAAFYYFGRKQGEDYERDTIRRWCSAFAIMYVALSFFSVLIGIGEAIDPVAGCEWIPANATLSGNTTTYAFVDSCAGISNPGTITAFFTIYLWLIWFELFMLVMGGFILAISFMRRVL